MLLSKDIVIEEPLFETITACRSCGQGGLVDILYLGIQPLANALVRPNGGPIIKVPLSTAFCAKCGLFQLKETVRKEVLFDHYVWVTKTSKAAREYAQTFADRVIRRAQLAPGDLVFEIASNDGTVLKQFMARQMAVVGIEPAKNIAEMAIQEGVRTECAYWNMDCAQRLLGQYGRPKVVMARNVIPHVSQLHSVMEAMAAALGDDAIGIIEFHSAMVIVQELHYDSIYHEHLCFFSAHSLERLLARYELHPFAADKSPISGGSVVLYFSKTKRPPTNSYIDLLSEEKIFGVHNLFVWENFAKQANAHRKKTLDLLNSLKGKRIIGFGSSARSSTFINFCGIGADYLKAIIDNNAMKQGSLTPAGDVPIVSFDQGMAMKPDVIFILAWNFGQEIMEECASRGFKGEYILPLPQAPRLIQSGH